MLQRRNRFTKGGLALYVNQFESIRNYQIQRL